MNIPVALIALLMLFKPLRALTAELRCLLRLPVPSSTTRTYFSSSPTRALKNNEYVEI
jgi:hypothetical protein